MKKIIDKDFLTKCTGCGACYNICPTNAISMIESHNTFLYPQIDEAKCINCGKCERTCIVNSFKKENSHPSKMYAFRANDEVRKKCSSGGAFPVLANYIIDIGGYVCGASFDENFKLKHTIINNKADLENLYSSKYLQSDIGKTYKNIEKLLKDNKTVLFCGTPCQVAGLKNVLGQNYNNLYTIDILCHGVPSQKVFDLYLEEISNGKKIKNVIFRNKIFGWSAEHIWVQFDDNSVYTKTRAEGDPYVKAFLENIDLRDSCETCQFSELPRTGDITIGDFWGIEKIDTTQKDNLGTSIILCNSPRGQDLLNRCIDNGSIKEYPLNKTLPNRIDNKLFSHSKQKERFFKLLNHHNFTESINYIRQGRYDIGLVCNYLASNFGGSLTQYSLFNVLEDLGYSVLMIERPLDAPEKQTVENIKQIYHKWVFNQCAKRYETKSDMIQLNDICDNFVVGSDVLFRHSLWKKMGKISTLDWVENTKRKIAYAASYGYDYIEHGATGTEEMSYYLQRFDAFSTREESGVKLFKDFFGINATHVLDPVFLCDIKHFNSMINNSKAVDENNFICSYLLDPTEDKAKILDYISNKLRKKVKVFSEFTTQPTDAFNKYLTKYDFIVLKEEDRLKYIAECDFFIADSFHGICFAIIYNKNFICIVNSARGATRFYSLLKVFGLEDRIVNSFDDVINNPNLLKPINYEIVNNILLNEKNRCLTWLRNALNTPKTPSYDDYDIINKKNVELTKQVEMLKKVLHVDYIFENKIFSFIEKLNIEKKHLIIIVSAKDTPGIAIESNLSQKLQTLGITTDLQGKHWCGYSAILYKGMSVDEKCMYEQSVETSFTTSSFEFKALSAPLNKGNLSSIKINNVEYSLNLRGLNFVVYDIIKQCVTDQVTFDTHLSNYPSKR